MEILKLEVLRNPHLPPADPEVLLDSPQFSAPPRPNTVFDRSTRRVLDAFPATTITWEDVTRFRENSLSTFQDMGVSNETTDQVRTCARWILADRPSPVEVQAVEAKFNRDDPDDVPLAIVYTKSPATSFPRRVTELFVQSGIDHLISHFTLGVKGLDPEDETKACLLQYMAAVERYKQGRRMFGAFALAAIPNL